ncbi:MAG TPA: hypothetical protein VIT68_04695 [Candidatus Gracilibacteria bacterium]
MEKFKNVDVVKFGTAVLTQKNGAIDLNLMASVGSVIGRHQSPLSVVSSGAVGFGKTMQDLSSIEPKLRRDRAYAAMGNRKLFTTWDEMIAEKHVWELLVTYAQIENGNRAEILERIQDALISNGIPMFNFNDAVSGEELKPDKTGSFGDNDHLATEVAGCASEVADQVRLIICTAASGVQEDLKDDQSTIAKLKTGELTEAEITRLCGEGSVGGTGGMDQKLRYMRNLLDRNQIITEGWIINGKESQILADILEGRTPDHGATQITVA